MTLHLVYEKPGVPSTRIRLAQMAPWLEACGLPCRLAPYPAGARARRRFAAALAPGDAVLIHRARPTRREMQWWRALPVPRLYDFDDAVMLGRRGGWRGALEARRRGAGFRRALASVDAATPGNAWLAAHCGDLPTAVIPSPVRLDVPRHAPRTDAMPLRVGWVGRSTNLRYVRAIAPALAELVREGAIRLVVVSDAPLWLADCAVEHVPWREADEADAVARFDVGIMPLSDDPWSRGKCAYKLLQYMAAGVPAVGSPVGANADLIDSGRNGFLARDPADWTRVLRALATDPALRARIGAAGRATVEAGYGYARVAERLAAFVSELSGAPSASSAAR